MKRFAIAALGAGLMLATSVAAQPAPPAPAAAPMPQIVREYTPAAFIVCSGLQASPWRLEDYEPPHTHPEPPSDKLLTDFFVPIRMYVL